MLTCMDKLMAGYQDVRYVSQSMSKGTAGVAGEHNSTYNSIVNDDDKTLLGIIG